MWNLIKCFVKIQINDIYWITTIDVCIVTSSKKLICLSNIHLLTKPCWVSLINLSPSRCSIILSRFPIQNLPSDLRSEVRFHFECFRVAFSDKLYYKNGATMGTVASQLSSRPMTDDTLFYCFISNGYFLSLFFLTVRLLKLCLLRNRKSDVRLSCFSTAGYRLATAHSVKKNIYINNIFFFTLCLLRLTNSTAAHGGLRRRLSSMRKIQ